MDLLSHCVVGISGSNVTFLTNGEGIMLTNHSIIDTMHFPSVILWRDNEITWFVFFQSKTLKKSPLPCSLAYYWSTAKEDGIKVIFLWVLIKLVVRDSSGYICFMHWSVVWNVKDRTEYQTLWNTLLQRGGERHRSRRVKDYCLLYRYKKKLLLLGYLSKFTEFTNNTAISF
jgi:hypothetical protein